MKWKIEKKNFDWSWREEPLSDRFGYMNNLLFRNINRYHLNFVLNIILSSNEIKEQKVFVIRNGNTLDYIKISNYPSSKSHYLKITVSPSRIYDEKVELDIYGDLGYGYIDFYLVTKNLCYEVER